MRMPKNDRGTSLIETMFAVLISLLTISGLGGAVVQVTAITKDQGQEATRATIYAQDKMEALLALNFTNCTKTSDVQPASCNTTGISAPGWTEGLLPGGDVDTLQNECPSTGLSVGYVDYLDFSGLSMTGSSCEDLASSEGQYAGYVRQWEISDVPSSGPAMKRISVAVFSMNQIRSDRARPLVVLTSVLSN
jgi:hypothetical protein